MTKTDVCKGYRIKYPDMPTMTLAKLIMEKEPELFLDVENIRGLLRRIEGKMGKAQREIYKGAHGDMYMDKPRPINPFDDLPKSSAKKRTPVNVEGNRILFLSDIHIPYHDIESLRIALKYGHDHGADCIFLNGDTLDFHDLSDYEKDPKKRRLGHELKQAHSFFDILRREFPKAHIYFKEGNHEERYWRFMRVKAPQLLDVQAFDLPGLLKLPEFNIQFIPGRTKANIGALSVFHGHEFGKSTFSPVNVARGLYMRAKANAICGHSHQTSEHTERDVNGKMVTTWSVGCLSELSPDFSPYNKWNHGFAFITREGKDFSVQNIRIYRGRIV
jgi:predicted phosphodiesterase